MSLTATLHAARQGDLRAFNRLVLDHQAAVYNLAHRLLGDAEAATEATQAAFVSALRELPAYREEAFLVWVLRWLVPACRLRLHRPSPRPPAADLPGCLAALPPAQRLALALVDIARLNDAQAAAVLGLSPAQLRCDLAAARRQVLTLLREAA